MRVTLQLKQSKLKTGFPWWLRCKESTCNVGDLGTILVLGRNLGEGNGQPTPVVLPGESPWTEGPGRLQSMGSKRIWTKLSNKT